MKKVIAMLLLCFAFLLMLAGCGNGEVKPEETEQTAQIANPWSDWSSIEEAEEEVGFSFELPDVIADKFTADKIRTMNKEMLEVVYCNEDLEICVRKKKGEEQDISGDYNQYETCEEKDYNGITVTSYYNSDNDASKQTFSYDGYSWSLAALNGYGGDYSEEFLNKIVE